MVSLDGVAGGAEKVLSTMTLELSEAPPLLMALIL